MKALKIIALSLCCGGFLATAAAQEKPCPRYQAPGVFKNSPTTWGKTDTGIIVDGFVDLISRQDSKPFDVMHGTDLSVYNTVSYDRIKNCGGQFSFVRLDQAFEKHTDQLSARGLIAIPYVFFRIPKELRLAATYSGAQEGSPALAQLLSKFTKIGTDAAHQSAMELKKREIAIQGVTIGTTLTKIVAVDIEEKLIDEAKSNFNQRIAYGRGYARALCSWVEGVRASAPDIQVMLYTMPAVYGDYLRYALEQDNACINGLPIWLAHTTQDGGDSVYSSARNAGSSFSDEASQRLCLVNGGNRCVVHQYSHRAIFAALGGKSKAGFPASTDINRWFHTTIIEAKAGLQYVRRDWDGLDSIAPSKLKKSTKKKVARSPAPA